MDDTSEEKIKDLENRIQSEVSRMNSVINSKITLKEFNEWKENIIEAYEDVKNDCRYLMNKINNPIIKESNKVNKIFVAINVILVIANILIIIGGK